MNNQKLMNSAKHLDTLAKVISIAFKVTGILCLIVAIALFALKDLQQITYTITLDFVKVYLTDQVTINAHFMTLYVIVGLIMISILCFIINYATIKIRGILQPMKEGRPFETGIPENLKKIAWSILLGGVLVQIVALVERILLIKACPIQQLLNLEAITNFEYTFSIDFSFVLLFCAFMFLSYIFSYGQILQKESDETL